MPLRVCAVVWLALVLASYPVLADRLASGGGAQAWAFYIAYSTVVITSALLILDMRQLWMTLTAVVRKLPIRSVVLLLNLLLVSLFIVFIAKHWGLIAVMFVGAAALFGLLHVSDPKRLSVTDKTVRFSPAFTGSPRLRLSNRFAVSTSCRADSKRAAQSTGQLRGLILRVRAPVESARRAGRVCLRRLCGTVLLGANQVNIAGLILDNTDNLASTAHSSVTGM